MTKIWTVFEELIKAIYTFFYHFFYFIFSVFIKKRDIDTVFIIKHSNNIRNYFKMYPEENFVMFSSNNNVKRLANQQQGCKKIISVTPWKMLQQIRFILRAKKVVIDDYYGPLYIIDSSKLIWNIWHSYAIYKKIGLDTPLYSTRNSWSIRRFYKNYHRTDCFFARSKTEKDIFAFSFKIPRSKIVIEPGYYQTALPKEIKNRKREKIVVYAPSHRSYKYDYNKVFRFLQRKFSDYTVIPVYHQLTVKNNHGLLEAYKSTNIIENTLKTAAIFVTDYSGLLIEANDLATEVKVYQMIDTLDFEKYNKIQGLNISYYPEKIEKLYFEEKE